MNKVYLSLGTNMGNRLGYLNRACGMIEDSVYVFSVKKSKIYETKAWGYTEQPDFLNICLEVDTSFNPHKVKDIRNKSMGIYRAARFLKYMLRSGY